VTRHGLDFRHANTTDKTDRFPVSDVRDVNKFDGIRPNRALTFATRTFRTVAAWIVANSGSLCSSRESRAGLGRPIRLLADRNGGRLHRGKAVDHGVGQVVDILLGRRRRDRTHPARREMEAVDEQAEEEAFRRVQRCFAA
jgi:hypothetical protein